MIFGDIGNKIADTVLYPIEQPFPKTPTDYGNDYKDVEFLPRDGVKLSSWLLNETANVVITLTHFGYRANRSGYQTRYQPRLTKPYKHEIEFVKVAKRLVDADVFVNNNVKALVGMQPLGNVDFLKAYGIRGAIYRHADEHYKKHTSIPLDYPIVPSIQ